MQAPRAQPPGGGNYSRSLPSQRFRPVAGSRGGARPIATPALRSCTLYHKQRMGMLLKTPHMRKLLDTQQGSGVFSYSSGQAHSFALPTARSTLTGPLDTNNTSRLHSIPVVAAELSDEWRATLDSSRPWTTRGVTRSLTTAQSSRARGSRAQPNLACNGC
jgi:hypothetical protein